MLPLRSLLAGSLLLAGCAAIAPPPPHAAPDPAVVERLQQLSADTTCDRAIAGTLTAYRIGPGRIVGIRRIVGPGDHDDEQNQAWIKLAGGGHIVVQYDPMSCWISTAYARDGAALPKAG